MSQGLINVRWFAPVRALIVTPHGEEEAREIEVKIELCLWRPVGSTETNHVPSRHPG